MEDRARPLLIIQDLAIGSRTRIQKYGFLIHKRYGRELGGTGFYSDWIPYHFGPYSGELCRDIDGAVRGGYLREEEDTGNYTRLRTYSTTARGAREYRRLIAGNSLLADVRVMLRHLQGQSLMSIIEQIYSDYPYYADRERMREAVLGRGRGGASPL